jgi:excisionase family DNA binding protein
METSPELLTSPEVSQLLRVSIRTVHRRVVAGELRALRKLPGPNGAFLFERADVDAYIEAAETAKQPTAHAS